MFRSAAPTCEKRVKTLSYHGTGGFLQPEYKVCKNPLNFNGGIMNIWHDISASAIAPERFEAVIEIPKGSKAKYELDKSTGMLRLDRILYTSTVYPANYGFIPRTLAEDGDALDVLVLSSEPILPMTLVTCAPIGLLKMVDGGTADEKVIAVALCDPTYKDYDSVSALPRHVLDEMAHFFGVYKALEHKETAVEQLLSASEAREVVSRGISAYNLKFGECK